MTLGHGYRNSQLIPTLMPIFSFGYGQCTHSVVLMFGCLLCYHTWLGNKVCKRPMFSNLCNFSFSSLFYVFSNKVFTYYAFWTEKYFKIELLSTNKNFFFVTKNMRWRTSFYSQLNLSWLNSIIFAVTKRRAKTMIWCERHN